MQHHLAYGHLAIPRQRSLVQPTIWLVRSRLHAPAVRSKLQQRPVQPTQRPFAALATLAVPCGIGASRPRLPLRRFCYVAQATSRQPSGRIPSVRLCSRGLTRHRAPPSTQACHMVTNSPCPRWPRLPSQAANPSLPPSLNDRSQTSPAFGGSASGVVPQKPLGSARTTQPSLLQYLTVPPLRVAAAHAGPSAQPLANPRAAPWQYSTYDRGPSAAVQPRPH